MQKMQHSLTSNLSLPKSKFAIVFLMTGYMMFVFSAVILFFAVSYDVSLLRSAIITFISGVPIATIGVGLFMLSNRPQ